MGEIYLDLPIVCTIYAEIHPKKPTNFGQKFYISIEDPGIKTPIQQSLSPKISNPYCVYICAIGSINSHSFHIIGDGKLNPIIGFYIPIIRIPSLKVG